MLKATLPLWACACYVSTVLATTFTSPTATGSIIGGAMVELPDGAYIFPGMPSLPDQALPTNQSLYVATDGPSTIGPVTSLPIPGYTGYIGHAVACHGSGPSCLVYGGMSVVDRTTAHGATSFLFSGQEISQGSSFPSLSLPRRLEHTLTANGTGAFLLGGHDGQGRDGAGLGSTFSTMRFISATDPVGVDRTSPPTGWWQHTATMVKGGRMVALGGVRSDGQLESLASVHVYDLEQDAWSVVPTTGDIPPARRDHAAVAISEGIIAISGGTDRAATTLMSDIYTLDTATWTWTLRLPQGITIPGVRAHVAFALPIEGDGTAMAIAMGISNATDPSDGYVTALSTSDWSMARDIVVHSGGMSADRSRSIVYVLILIPISIISLIFIIFTIRRKKRKLAREAKLNPLGTPQTWGSSPSLTPPAECPSPPEKYSFPFPPQPRKMVQPYRTTIPSPPSSQLLSPPAITPPVVTITPPPVSVVIPRIRDLQRHV